MASITQTLPIELIAAIIASLAAPIFPGRRGNRYYDPALNDLKACSLACRHFLPLCQRCIFNTIGLKTHNKRSKLRRFAEIVETSPIIGSYVQILNLWITPKFDHFEVDYYPDIIASALRSLTNLKIIFLMPREVIDWRHIPSSLTSEIYRLFQLPTITTIQINRMRNFNIHSLARCSGLADLTLQDISVDEISTIPSTTMCLKPVQPIQLYISGSSTEIGLLTKISSSKLSERHFLFDFGRLKYLLLTITYMDDVRPTSDFLRQLKSPFLETIDLRFAKGIDRDGIAALSLNSAMKVVRYVFIWLTFPASGINEHLIGMGIFLQNLSAKNRIRALKINMYYHVPSTSSFLDDPNWDVVNDTLVGPGWSSLTKVELVIMAYTDRESLPQAIIRSAMLKKRPQTRLKGLSSNKSFKFLWTLKSIVQDPRGFQYTAEL